jgi:hypothetical protein
VGEGVIERVKGCVVGIAVREPVLQVVTERVTLTERVKEVVTLLVARKDGRVVGIGDGDPVMLRLFV